MTAPTTSQQVQGLDGQVWTDETVALDRQQRLEELFTDTLGQEISRAAIVIEYFDNSNGALRTRTEIGFPYRILRDGEYHAEGARLGCYGDFYLEIGPYAKSGNTIPSDSELRTKKIRLRDILSFQRLDIKTHIPK